MRRTLAVMAMVAFSVTGAAGAQGLIPMDDSYTVSQRYYANKQDHPEFKIPILQFEAGQQVLFDRLYKKIGNRELHIDVFLPPPARASHQAILFVHGGAWRSGNKSNFYSLANLLAQRGYIVLIPEFRLAPEAVYPAGLIDVNDAIVWAKSQANEFGFDAGKLAIGGESSGGQMAALLAYSASHEMFKSAAKQDTRVNALIDLDGVLDFTTPLALQNENAGGARSVAALWLGGSYEAAGDKWREASAAHYVDATSPPTLIVSGEAPRFTAGREQVTQVLDQHHIRHAHLAFEHAPHTFWLFEPYLSKVALGIDDFLRPMASPEPKP